MNNYCIFAKPMVYAKYEETPIEFKEIGYNIFERPFEYMKYGDTLKLDNHLFLLILFK